MNLRAGLIGATLALITGTTSAAQLDDFGVARFDKHEQFAADLILSLNWETMVYVGNKNLFSDFMIESANLTALGDFETIHVGTVRDDFNFDPFKAQKKYFNKLFILTGCAPTDILYSKADPSKKFIRCDAKYRWGRIVDVSYEKEWNKAVEKWYDRSDVIPFVCDGVRNGAGNPVVGNCIPVQELSEVSKPVLRSRLLGGVYTGMTIYMDEMLKRDQDGRRLIDFDPDAWMDTRAVFRMVYDRTKKNARLRQEITTACRKRVQALKLNPKYCKMPRGI